VPRAYPSIPHLPGSRTGPADRHVSPGQASLCTTADPRRRDDVIVQEKLDGSCVAAARVADELIALGREGRLAADSQNPARRMWAAWVARERERFMAVLEPGERLIGEWLTLAHATRYALPHEPFVAFDLMRGPERLAHDPLGERLALAEFVRPGLVHRGPPIAVAEVLARLGRGFHGAIDPVEGAIWRVERTARVILVAKFVRSDKLDGALLPENTGEPAIWNSFPWTEPP
jgi:hypothetical protein